MSMCFIFLYFHYTDYFPLETTQYRDQKMQDPQKSSITERETLHLSSVPNLSLDD
jgi:hypothetical protein